MLIQVTAQIHRLDATHNDLGTVGAIALFEGLKAVRSRLSANLDGYWGMSEINLAANNIGNEGMVAAAFYCARDLCMRELFLQNNSITVSVRPLPSRVCSRRLQIGLTFSWRMSSTG